jgi:hypothetical protein
MLMFETRPVVGGWEDDAPVRGHVTWADKVQYRGVDPGRPLFLGDMAAAGQSDRATELRHEFALHLVQRPADALRLLEDLSTSSATRIRKNAEGHDTPSLCPRPPVPRRILSSGTGSW